MKGRAPADGAGSKTGACRAGGMGDRIGGSGGTGRRRMKPAAKILFSTAAALWTAAAQGVLLTTWRLPPNLKALEEEYAMSTAMATLRYLDPTAGGGTPASAYQWVMGGSLAGAAVSLGGTSFAPRRGGGRDGAAGAGEDGGEDDALLLAYLFGEDGGEYEARLAAAAEEEGAAAGAMEAFRPLCRKIMGWGTGRISGEKEDVLSYGLDKSGTGRGEVRFDFAAAWGRPRERAEAPAGGSGEAAEIRPVAPAGLLPPEAVVDLPLTAMAALPVAEVGDAPAPVPVEEPPEESPGTIAHASQWRLFETTPILDWVQSTIPEEEPSEPLWKRGWTD